MSDPRIKLKRSAVSGKIPSANDLPLGELALNTYDGKLYASKNVGIGTTVFAINPWAVGLGSDTYNIFFTSGSVGIGTTVPTSKLHVVGDFNIVGVSTFTGNATLSNIVLNGTISAGTNVNSGGMSANHDHGFNAYSINATSTNSHGHTVSSSPTVNSQNISHTALPSIFYVNFMMKV